MSKSFTSYLTVLVVFLILLAACSPDNPPLPFNPTPLPTQQPTQKSVATGTVDQPTPEKPEPRILTICTGEEPESLFLYGNSVSAAPNILQAIYDGPVDVRGFEPQPVILEKLPSLDNGGARFEPAEVIPGDLIADDDGNWVNLKEGVVYRPSGCTNQECALTYTGNQTVTMESLVLQFFLLPGMKWSDGSPLTASDSVYSFELAKSLYPSIYPDIVSLTQSYQALDDLTLEWRGIPGYQGGQPFTKFFSPLPQHAWGMLTAAELLSSELSSRKPIGWGPYKISEWTAGDHITLDKNPLYFRAEEKLPNFDQLVFRFVSDPNQALAALLAGECDLADETSGLDSILPRLVDLENSGKIKTAIRNGTAWEQASFGVVGINDQQTSFFTQKEVRQAIAACIDREAIKASMPAGKSFILDTYTLPSHPLFNPDARKIAYNPQQAADMLTAAGWVDHDGDPATPRVAQGVAGIPDGTEFRFNYLASNEEEKKRTTEIIKDSLGKCGIQVETVLQNWQELLAPGPQGPIFGRQFEMAQYGWTTTLEPACALFQSQEIPGPYPGFAKGWGGANATGYTNPTYDAACKTALTSLPESPAYAEAHKQAQAIFADDLPALPLYTHLMVAAMRPDMCGVVVNDALDYVLWNLEALNYGEACN